jgi:alkylation response protein AidB-like acyl-CoA dehydrogenase
MSENYFKDNLDLQFRLNHLDLSDILEIKERGYTYAQEHPVAPRSYPDAMDNYRLMLELLGDICANIVAPTAAEADEEGAQFHDGEVEYAAVTQEAIKALIQAELMGAMLPWVYGGLNLPESIYQIMVELVSRAEAGLMTVFGLQEIASSISEFGDDEIKARLLPRFARGEVTGAMVLTEPDAGSDLSGVQTRASFDETAGFWRLNGVKRFITNGNADVHVVLARSEAGSSDARGLSLFVIERDETVKIRRIENKLGIHASPTCEIQYNNTPAWLIGKRRFGLIRYSMALMNGARLAVGAQAVGIAEAAYREAYKYAKERIQFNKPIRDLPAVSRMLLSMRGEIEAARALISETGLWVDRLKAYEQLKAEGDTSDPTLRKKQKKASNLADTLTPLTKYYASEMGNRVCDLAIQIHGGVGYMREFNVERLYRDVRVTNIYEGTSQLQIVAALGKLLGHSLDVLFSEWTTLDYGADLDSLKEQLIDATDLYKKAIDALKEKDSDIIDYYAVDLTDMAVYVVNSWLLLQDALISERKRDLARLYIIENLPKVHAAGDTILIADDTPLQARNTILADEF